MVTPAAEPETASKAPYLHYAWLVVAIAVVLQITTNFVSQAFSILIPVLRDEFAWSPTAIVLAYVFRSVVSAVLSPVAGWVGDRYGARRSLFVAAAGYIAGLLLLSTVSQIWQLYLYYSVVLGVTQ